MDAPWITVSFVPTTTYVTVSVDAESITTERTSGWLVQHRYDNDSLAVPTESRVIAGICDAWPAEIIPVRGDSTHIQVYGCVPGGCAS